MSVHSVALASLTAVYTDSEDEDVFDEEFHENMAAQAPRATQAQSSPKPLRPIIVSPKATSFSNRISSNNQGTIQTTTEVSGKVHRLLVSYHDDTMISDDEGGVSIVVTDVPRPIENGAAAMSVAVIAALPDESPTRPTVVSDDEEADAYGVVIPPEPAAPCPPELQDKITKLYQRMLTDGLDMNKVIQERKDFRNPSIYEKLIQFCGINELGTNYPPDKFDPFKWGKDSYYDELAKVQKAEIDKLEKARKEKTKCEIVSGTVKRPSSTNTTEDEAKRRKSKWDQVASGTVAPVKPTVLLAQPTLNTLTASATGTKATVISSFGSLQKKRL